MDSVEFLVSLEQWRSGVTDAVFVGASWLGLDYFYMAVIIAIYLCVGPRLGFRVLLLFLLSAYVNTHLKMAFDTVRPFVQYPQTFLNPLRTDWAGGGSFPSGHAQNAAAVWGLLSIRQRRWAWRVLMLLLVVLIAFSRLYCQVHWPIDVVGGLLIGTALMLAYICVLGAIRHATRRPSLAQWALIVIVASGALYFAGLLRLWHGQFGVDDVGGCLRAAGGILGAGLGYVLLEARGFSPEAPVATQVLKVGIAWVVMVGLYEVLRTVFGHVLGEMGVWEAIVGFIGTYVLPACFMEFGAWRSRRRGGEAPSEEPAPTGS